MFEPARAAATTLCILLGLIGPACVTQSGQPAQSCGGTGVDNPTASVSIDLGSLLRPAASAKLQLGDILYIGANACEQYTLPNGTSVQPILIELSRHQQARPGRGTTHTLDVLYKAAGSGSTILTIGCHGNGCAGAQIFVTVQVQQSGAVTADRSVGIETLDAYGSKSTYDRAVLRG